MSSSGTNILASDFVAIQDKAQSLLGSGTITRGYGQPVLSSDVYTGNNVTKAQWDALRYDITSIRYHQDGVLPNIVTVYVGDVIGYGAGSPNTNYDTLLETAIANRFQLAPAQSIVTSIGSGSTSSAWSTSATCTLTCTFSNSNEARYFFNSGGRIRVTPTLTGGSGTAQINAWINILNTVGTQSFGAANDSPINFYTLTNSYQTFYTQTLSTPYSANNFTISAKCDVANNSTGTASVLYLQVILTDSYTGVGGSSDSVDGTLALTFAELKASGNLFPTGAFSINSPTYSISSVTTS